MNACVAGVSPQQGGKAVSQVMNLERLVAKGVAHARNDFGVDRFRRQQQHGGIILHQKAVQKRSINHRL
jgi:hypothetical protein